MELNKNVEKFMISSLILFIIVFLMKIYGLEFDILSYIVGCLIVGIISYVD